MSGQAAKPKIFIDYIAYARSIGKPVKHIADDTIVGTRDGVFTQNPSKTNIIERTSTTVTLILRLEEDVQDLEFAKLVQSVNYVAMLNHNMYDCGFNNFFLTGLTSNNTSQDYVGLSGTETYGSPSLNGFILWQDFNNGISPLGSYGISMMMVGAADIDPPLSIGSVSIGRSFSFPHNANLSMKISYNNHGIKRSRTSGGSDIVNINYSKQPDWDGRPPFVATNASGLSATSYVGSRSWDLTFSYLSPDNTFPQNMGEDFIFDNVFDDNGNPVSWTNHTTDNITSHFMALTCNGQIPFIFQPSDNKNTFAMCRLRSKSFSVEQAAPNLYTCKMTFDEVVV